MLSDLGWGVQAETPEFQVEAPAGEAEDSGRLRDVTGRVVQRRLNQLTLDYKAKGINVIGINSNSTEDLAWVKSHAEENYKFPMLIDKGNVIADKFDAQATPEIFFFDKNDKLVYHGAIDNDRGGSNVTSTYLRDALNEYLDGKAITTTKIKAFGCSIKRV